MMAKRANEHCEEDELRQAFRVFDKNGNGFVKVAELRYSFNIYFYRKKVSILIFRCLRHMMTNLGEQFSDNEVDEILREFDTSSNGIIQYEGKFYIQLTKNILLLVRRTC